MPQSRMADIVFWSFTLETVSKFQIKTILKKGRRWEVSSEIKFKNRLNFQNQKLN